jgi:hypothetical protein
MNIELGFSLVVGEASPLTAFVTAHHAQYMASAHEQHVTKH